MNSMLNGFVEWSKVRNYSDLTIVQRRRYIQNFIDWAEQRGLATPAEVTKAVLERYQRWMYLHRRDDGSALSFRTQYNRLLALRAWFSWMARAEHIADDPTAKLELPKLEHRLPKHILSANEAENVLNEPDVAKPLGARDRAILETLYSTGIRRAELIGLNVFDVDAERGVVAVRQGKGKKDRMIPIGSRAAAWVRKYIHDARPKLIGDAHVDALFLTKAGKRFSPRGMTKLVSGYVGTSAKQGSCHLFRHTMATLMHDAGADIRFIQQMLGHANVSTTQIYTQVSIRKLKEIHDATHPAKSKRKPDGNAGS